jgi:hypothetical protein
VAELCLGCAATVPIAVKASLLGQRAQRCQHTFLGGTVVHLCRHMPLTAPSVPLITMVIPRSCHSGMQPSAGHMIRYLAFMRVYYNMT